LKALEIGSYQGASSAIIAKALAPDGYLICIDPWPDDNAEENSCRLIFERKIRRAGLQDLVRVLRGFSRDVQNELPRDWDFVFIDGDHSWEGIETDWNIVSPRMRRVGIVCLHNTVIPAAESWRDFPSVDYYREVIAKHESFERIEEVYSMTVLKRRQRR
jgi:predicted O-methyltransferase YrrM